MLWLSNLLPYIMQVEALIEVIILLAEVKKYLDIGHIQRPYLLKDVQSM